MTAPSGARSGYDPFAPAAGSAFPERRLRRAGLDGDAVDRLRAEWDGADEAGRRELSRFITRSPDSRIRDRFQGRRSRAELEELTIPQLEPLLKERRLSLEGRKADLIDRLLRSYEGAGQEQPTRAPQEAATAPQAPAPAGNTPAPPQAAQGGDAAPAAEATPPAAPVPDGTVPPAESPGAAPAPDAAPAADTTTEE